jgi:hypothetical protein
MCLFFADYISRFLFVNKAEIYIANELLNFVVGRMPLIDHWSLCTLDVDKWSGNLLPI